MAKKGGVQQLQAEINTDEEFDKFLERPGLLVLDVYSEWCGPCLGMVGSLRKIKLEFGGDNLQLAICKSDTITALKRFNKKSEPTWLFVTNGMAVNLMFGTNVPKLMTLIKNELVRLNDKNRQTFGITELQPEEVKRRKVKEDAVAESVRIEQEEQEKKRRDYLTYVTDTIMENMPDIGVTLFGPQVNRDMFKKIMEPADAIKIQCKDRKVIPVYKENFEIVNFMCKNPIPEDVLDQFQDKELLLCFWKMPEDSRSVPKTLELYAHELTKPRVEQGFDPNDEDHQLPPILTTIDVKFEVELQEGEECIEEEEPEDVKSHKSRKSSITLTEAVGEEIDEDEEEEGEGSEDEGEGEGMEPPEMELDMPEFDLGLEDEEVLEESEPLIEEPPKIRTCKRKVTLPPIWVPDKHRAHAAMIYVFFRSQTAPFLPPDPVPEPPHVIMAFDVYKKNDLIGIAARHKDDVPVYGFFTSDDPEEAKFIANSAQKYATQPHTASDKIVFKVNKQTSHTMLSMATYNPSYVSPNTVVGHEEALKFFGGDYKTAEQEMLEEQELEAQEPKRKRRTKKSVTDGGQTESPRVSTQGAPVEGAPQEAAATDGAPTEEGATTSGEESGESRPPTAEGDEGAAAPEGEEPAEPPTEVDAEAVSEVAPEAPPAEAVEAPPEAPPESSEPPPEAPSEPPAAEPEAPPAEEPPAAAE